MKEPITGENAPSTVDKKCRCAVSSKEATFPETRWVRSRVFLRYP